METSYRKKNFMKKTGVTTNCKNKHFVVSFSFLCTGEFQHKAYTGAHSRTHYTGTRTFNDFESEIA